MSEKALTTADKLQLQKKTTFSTQLAKAEGDFLKMYGAEGERTFLQEQKYAIMAVQKNPKILDCTGTSIYTAVSLVAMSGLSLNPTKGLAYLIPRAGVCTLSVSYKGVLELLSQDAGIMCTTGVVYDCDENVNDYKEGYGGYVNAQRKMNRPDGATRLYTYNVAHFKDGRTHCFIFDNNQVEKRRKKAQVDDVWKEWEDEMYMKTVIHAHYKYLPKTEKLDAVMQAIESEVAKPLVQANADDLLDDIQEVAAEVVVEQKPVDTVTVETNTVKKGVPEDI
jgi:recombination protein RecT